MGRPPEPPGRQGQAAFGTVRSGGVKPSVRRRGKRPTPGDRPQRDRLGHRKAAIPACRWGNVPQWPRARVLLLGNVSTGTTSENLLLIFQCRYLDGPAQQERCRSVFVRLLTAERCDCCDALRKRAHPEL